MLNAYEFGKQDCKENWYILAEDFTEFESPVEERIKQNYDNYSDMTEEPESYENWKDDYVMGWSEQVKELLDESIINALEDNLIDTDKIDLTQWSLQQKEEFFRNSMKGIEEVKEYIKSLED